MKLKAYYVIMLLFLTNSIYSQLETCSGNKGIPVFFEDFGNNKKTAKQASDDHHICSYKYANNTPPKEGYYTISNKFNWFPHWFKTEDHTEGDKKGNALLVNIHEEKIEHFFRKEISGLCSGVTYEFSAWLLNLSSSKNSNCTESTSALGGLPANIRFEIWDETEKEILKAAYTGQIFSEDKPVWNKYGMLFEIVPGQERVVLKMINYARGGCGNDIAIDDIQFASCGDETLISTNINAKSPMTICENDIADLTLTCTSDFSMFEKHYYKWEKSIDAKNYTEILSGTSSVKIQDSLAPGNHYYRVRVAENKEGLINENCNSVSEYFLLKVIKAPEAPKRVDAKDFCSGEDVVLKVETKQTGTTIHWFDKQVAGKELAISGVYEPGKLPPGNYTYYAETRETDSKCISSVRTSVTVKVHEPLPELKEDKSFVKCPQDVVTLDSEVDDVEYLWNTGETTKTIDVLKEGDYSVTIHAINNDFCKTSRNFFVRNIKGPMIKKIKQNGSDLTVELEVFNQNAVYEYSINGGATFKESPTFTDIKNGRYKFYAKRIDSCGVRGAAFQFVKLNNMGL